MNSLVTEWLMKYFTGEHLAGNHCVLQMHLVVGTKTEENWLQIEDQCVS